jgi:thioredoxin 1
MGLKMITSNNYEENVVLAVQPVIINLWAKWCSPCDIVGKYLSEIAEEYDGYVKVVQMNLEQQPELTEMFEVDTLPLVLMMTGGVICKKIHGVPPKEELIEELELETIKDFRDRGITYHPKRNYVPGYIRDERW